MFVCNLHLLSVTSPPPPLQAMQCLHNTEGASGNDSGSQSPLVAWLRKHGSSSLTKLDQLEGSHQDGKKTVSFDDPGGKEKVQAIIDSDDKLSAVDRLSQVSVIIEFLFLDSSMCKRLCPVQWYGQVGSFTKLERWSRRWEPGRNCPYF